MSFRMKIDAKEVLDWVNNQSNREKAKKQALIVMKDELVKEAVKEADEIKATGQLKAGISGRTYSNRIEIYSPFYGDIALEYGRQPGKMPPVEPLKRWAGLKLGDPSLGYVIARKIAREGTEKYKRGGPKQISQIEERFKEDILPSKIPKLLTEYTK